MNKLETAGVAASICLLVAVSAQASDKAAMMGWEHPAVATEKPAPKPAPAHKVMAPEHHAVVPVPQPHSAAAAPKATMKAHHAMMPKNKAHTITGHHSIHWSYRGIGAPQYWGDLKEEYRLCKEGQSQSPIDISAATVTSLPGIQVAYQETALDILNNGHAIQINYAPGSSITVAGKSYALLQFHFHSPSEHTVGGKAHDMVAHLVHKAADGQLAVIGILIDGGAAADNPVISKLWQSFPVNAGDRRQPVGVTVNVADLLPADLNYFNYSGSLTTPPCSEGVNWFLLSAPVQISNAQLEQFRASIFNDARPVQAVNGRTVRLGN